MLFACPPLVAFYKHLLAHIFVSTIAFLTVNFRMRSQDKGICEQTEILIVAFCLAECSPSNICLCDTQGLLRAVGCPSAACPRLGDAHQWDLLPSHLAATLAAGPKLMNFGVPWKALMALGWLLCLAAVSPLSSPTTARPPESWVNGTLEKDCPAACRECLGCIHMGPQQKGSPKPHQC